MEHEQSTWINISFCSLLISIAFHLTVNRREKRDRQREGAAPQETDTLR